MKSFSQLKGDSRKEAQGFPYKLAVMGDCATQHLSVAIKGTGYSRDVAYEMLDVDYDLIGAQVMNPNSELYEFNPNGVVIFMCTQRLYESFCEESFEQKNMFAQNTFAKIKEYWSYINKFSKTNILQFTFGEIDDRVFGNYAGKIEQSFLYQVRLLNMLVMQGAQSTKNVYLVDLCALQSRFGSELLYSDKFYYIAKMPINLEILPYVASEITDIVRALQGQMKKCIVLDLDNTLWGGVIGDDGLQGIQIGELGQGHAFSDFQLWLKQLKQRGIILAVCSKNNEDTAKEPFLHHPDMILKLEDISVFVANWEDKAQNIRHIQKTLNIGMDSMVFLDDNPFERNVVHSLIPEISVPNLPEDPASYVRFLRNENLFETVSFSDADKQRAEQYLVQAQRAQVQAQFATYDDYLKELQMEAKANPFDAFQVPRIAQLTQRSNQFNLRTVRYTEAEIELVSQDSDYLTLYFTLKDQFGDHGLISVVIMKKESDDVLFVDTWLMSCRVLKRGMEEFIVNTMVDTAKQHGFHTIIGEYLQTPKNAMVADIYEQMGFVRSTDSKFVCQVRDYSYKPTFITLEGEQNK